MNNIEAKLNKAVAFIEKINHMDIPVEDVNTIMSTTTVYCPECGESIDTKNISSNDEYVNVKFVEELKEDAWHILADLIE